MASLSAMPRAASDPQRHAKRQKAAPAEAEAVGVAGGEEDRPEIGGATEEFVIARVIGGSRLETDAAVFYRLEWQGYTDINWQGLPEFPQVDADSEYLGFRVRVMPLGNAAYVLEHGRCRVKKQQIIILVLGELTGQGTRLCHEATGTPHELGMLQCTFDGQPMDWLMDQDRSRVWLTDSIIDWAASTALSSALEEFDGSCYPSHEDMRAVLLHLGNHVMVQLTTVPPQVQHMALEIAIFLGDPSMDRLPIVVGHAAKVRDMFLHGGLIRDCLSLLVSFEPNDVRSGF
jgi:hypothetical protein